MKAQWIRVGWVATVLGCAVVDVGGAQGADLVAGEVFRRYGEVVGGREVIEAVRVMRVKGIGQQEKETFEFELTFKGPGKLLLVAGKQGQAIARMGRDSNAKCWRQDPFGVRELDGQAAGEIMDLALALNAPAVWGLLGRMGEVECQVQIEGEGEGTTVVVAADNPSFPRLTFDRQLGYLTAVAGFQVEDYRSVGGLRVPFRVRQGSRSVFRVDEVELNPEVEDGIFERPEGVTTLSDRGVGGGGMELTTRLSSGAELEIVRRPEPANFGRGYMLEMPVWDPKSSRHAQVDLRGFDLTKLDLTAQLTNLLHADFDSVTRWPARLPVGYDWQRVLALGMDPGLGTRALHRRGITGRGVGIGILDQPLLVNHVEYRDRLRLYEEIHSPAAAPAQMHGPAVASIAVGRSVGMAPEAELYYIAEQHGVFRAGGFDWDFTWLAQSIDRLLEVNRSLPAERRIRVISVSVGWSPQQKGYQETMEAVGRATEAGVFVVSTAIEGTHRLAFHGLGREVMSDPNDWNSYGPGSWWSGVYWSGQHRFVPGERLLVPMDSRGVASPTGPEDYVFYWSAGWSWSVPWIAGLYALACQVQPEVTPELFWAKALETGRTVRISHEGGESEFGTIADPGALIAALEAGR